MPLISQPSSAAKTSLAYITVGALLLVWTGIWYLYMRNNPEGVQLHTWYFCYGLMATGAVSLVIGLAVGRIGRQARHADLPPAEVTQQQARIDQAAAAQPIVVAPAPANPAVQPGVVPAIPVRPAVPVNSVLQSTAPRV
jgi:hypothetical protein